MTKQLTLISVANEPIQGTNLYRRWQGEQEISPEYRGNAQNELEAIEQAKSLALRSVTYGDSTFVEIGGVWYCWAFPWKEEHTQ